MKLGVCTGGGDCPGLNAVIRAVVKAATGKYQMDVIGVIDSFNGLMERPLQVKPLGANEIKEILERGGTILGTTNAGNPFAFADADGKPCDKSQLVIDGYHNLGLDALIIIGGDGTQSIAGRFAKMGLNLIGIPKTIDNDQAATDMSVGFQTAVNIAADALSRLRTTAESHDRIMVVELMGRDAGHIALHSGIASGADVILIPEIPFTYESIVAKIEEKKRAGINYSIIAVAEGAFPKGQSPSYDDPVFAKYQTKHLGGIGATVAEKLHELTGLDTRLTVLGHVQRGGTPGPYDRVLGTLLGSYAVELSAKGRFGEVVGIKQGKLACTPFDQLIGVTSPVALDSQYLHAAEAIGICMGRDAK